MARTMTNSKHSVNNTSKRGHAETTETDTIYVHIWAFQDMGLILMTSGNSIYGHKGESYMLVSESKSLTDKICTFS